MTDFQLYNQITNLPPDLKKEVADFVEFLKLKKSTEPKKKNRPVFGSAKGFFILSPDFDEPLEDFKEYM
jgi:hypothetical protein